MKNSSIVKNISLTSYDDIFQTDKGHNEKIVEIPLTELHTFANHPFRITDDEKMQETAESIRQYGVLTPGIARPRADGGYELIAGHRRKRACELAEIETMPVILEPIQNLFNMV